MNVRNHWPKIPLWIILAVAGGAILLGALIFGRDYRREREFLHNVFLQRGELFINSLEMVGRMRSEENWADTLGLFWNNLEDSDGVLFIALTDAEGQVLALAGETDPGTSLFRDLPPAEAAPHIRGSLPKWRLEHLNGELIYLVYRPFQPLPRMRGMHHNMMMRAGRHYGPARERDQERLMAPLPLRYVWVGFTMGPFEAASQKRMQTAALFVLLFCLAGLGGMLALFWGHHSRLSRKMYEEIKAELVQQRRLATLGGLAAGLAHEIRNPLGAIRGLSQHLLKTVDPAERETLEVMLTSVDRLNATITDFLDYARPPEIKPRALDVAELLRNMATLATHDARSQQVEVRLDLPPAPLMIHGDEALLAQAFLNIYLNAIQAAGGREGALLTVALKQVFELAVITFHDNGPGFSPEQLAQAFVPYFTTKAEGSGLGLALVEKSVRAHEGADISLATPPSGGALVTISFPALKAEETV